MAAMKTVQTDANVNTYLDNIEDEKRRQDCRVLIELMSAATNQEPKMWGPSIVGFGRYDYKYQSGREGSSCKIGFSSRKGNIALYGLPGASDAQSLLEKLGKYKTGKGCLYLNQVSDANLDVLEKLAKRAFANTKQHSPTE
jgi:Domain of unknown function (DU1801)